MPDIFDPAIFDPVVFDTGEVEQENPLYTLTATGTLGGGTAQNFQVFISSAFTLEVAMSPVVDITGWTFAFKIRDRLTADDPELISQTTGFTITSAEDGEFEVVLDNNTTDDLLERAYRWEIWRTNAGQEYVLCWGAWVARY